MSEQKITAPKTCRECANCREMFPGEGLICLREPSYCHPVEGWEHCNFWEERTCRTNEKTQS